MANVVVVDDRVTNRNILTRLARSVEEGIRVDAFAEPASALQSFLNGSDPDLLITDFNMPEMDGAEFIRAVRNIERLAELPIIVVTVYEDREYCYRALEAGATDFLLSPVDHLEFRSRARNLLTLRRQQRLLSGRAADLERELLARLPAAAGTCDLADRYSDLPVAVSVTDAGGRLTHANDAYRTLFGLGPESPMGQQLSEVHDEELALRLAILDEKVLQTGKAVVEGHEIDARIGGEDRRLLVTKSPMRDAFGTVRSVLSVTIDISRHGAPATPPPDAGTLDPITGLAGDRLFRDRVQQELGRSRREHSSLALLHLDLDRFKGINDAFGQEFGNQLLKAVGQRLDAKLRETDTMARIEQDSFVILQYGVKRSDDAAEFARRLGEAFAAPFVIGERELHISASIGITLFPGDGKTLEVLMKNAELAMFRAKSSGRDGYRFFAREMNVAARRAVALERELRQALAGEQFVVHYQPQIDLRSRRINGMEALVRWNHPYRGLVWPGEFINLAEDIGLIAPLTAWVLRTACQRHRAWRDMGFHDLTLSVNLSPVQFRERGVELMIERILKDTDLPAESLDVELTENAVIENSATASASLRYLSQLGVKLSIDDFGTGYSSLSYVKRLPVNRLKIDQSFVQNLEHNPNDEVIVKAIINLGHSLGLRVIAEGVETEGQLRFLIELGCDEIQGDLISRPLPDVAFEALLTSDIVWPADLDWPDKKIAIFRGKA